MAKKLYHGTSRNVCKKFKKEGEIPENLEFLNVFKQARVFALRHEKPCVLETDFDEDNFELIKEKNYVFEEDLKIEDRYYRNKKPIIKFKTKLIKT